MDAHEPSFSVAERDPSPAVPEGHRWHGWLMPVVVTAVLALTAFAVYHLTTEVRYEEVVTALSATPPHAILLALLFTAMSFAALVGYDLTALRSIGRRLPLAPVALTAFSAYAVGNTVGFGALSGGAIRLRAYGRLGLSPEEIGRVIAFVTVAFGLGLTGTTALFALATADRVAALLSVTPATVALAAGAALALLAALLVAGRHGLGLRLGRITIAPPAPKNFALQFLFTLADIVASASVLYVLLPETALGWAPFVAVFATAVGLGVLSHVPAGLGVFETVIIAALGNSASLDAVLGSLVLYRAIYYILPLALAVLFVIGSEVSQLSHHPVATTIRKLESRLVPSLLAAFAAVLGVMLIFSAVTPKPDEDLLALAAMLPLPVVEGAHFLSSLIGLVMIVAARGLHQRLDGAWWIALVSAAAALLFCFLKALAPVEATALGLFLAGLLLSRRQFARPASLFRQVLSPGWITAILCVLTAALTLLLFVYRHVDYSHDLWWQFEFTAHAPRGLRAVLGLTILALAFGTAALLRPARQTPAAASADDLARAASIVAGQDVADANLVRMGDKRLMFAENGRAFLMYGVQGRSWIALFDPVGDPRARADLVWRFIETAREAGCRAVFYQITPGLLPHCADAGLRAVKLGELAVVDLTRFELTGSRLAGLRQVVNRGLREGLSFEILPTEAVPEALPALRTVSDAWLAHHETREKTFSLGAFREDYVASGPVAVLRKDGAIVAFATLLVTDTRAEGTVDLMRFLPDAPKGSMDFLFVRIMEHLKAEGYRAFNLGMAPLAGMSTRDAAPVWDKLGGALFQHGERFYNFKGLRAFKSKFQPAWEPRYLAVSGGLSPLVAIMDAALLIGGGLKGVVSK